MSNVTQSTLVREDTTGYEALAGLTVAVAAVSFVVGLAAMLEVITLSDSVAGVGITTLLGGVLALLGVAVVTFGVGSRLEYIATSPQASAGVVAAAAFSGIWFAVGGLVGSTTLGLGTIGWLGVATVTGGIAFAVTAFPREDVGSTVPAGALGLFAGLVILSGTIGTGWEWVLTDFNATINAEIGIPIVVQFSALITGWAGAKAYGGYGARGRHLAAHLLIYLNVLAILSVLVGLILFVTIKGVPGLFEGVELGLGVGPGVTLGLFGFEYTLVLPISWPFLSNGVSVLVDVDGVMPAIVGTVWLVIGAVVFAVPLGIGAAVFLSEYATEGRFTRAVEVATNSLWSTPSIVFGLFGYAFLVPRFGNSRSLLAGMLTLGFMLLPLVLITSREAMLAVPDEYRDASAALGVTKWQTIRSVVLPAAVPGITTGVILGVGRIAGETAPILLTMAGGTFVPGSRTVDVLGGFQFTASPPFVSNPALLEATSALPYQLYALITAGLGQNSPSLDSPDNFAWGLALTLLIVVLAFYAVGIATRYYFRKKLNQ